MKNSIVCGYQGIGKSSIATNPGYVDLESSSFIRHGSRQSDWYEIYCEIAMNIAKQGKTVLLSSHKEVRDYLYKHKTEDIELYTCFPTLGLKDMWIKRLSDRYIKTMETKDYKALKDAEKMYTVNINSLKYQEGFNHIEIFSLDYDLKEVLELEQSL